MGVTFKSADCLPSMMLGSFAVETQTLLWWPIPQHWGIQQFLTTRNLTEQALHLILGIFSPWECGVLFMEVTVRIYTYNTISEQRK